METKSLGIPSQAWIEIAKWVKESLLILGERKRDMPSDYKNVSDNTDYLREKVSGYYLSLASYPHFIDGRWTWVYSLQAVQCERRGLEYSAGFIFENGTSVEVLDWAKGILYQRTIVAEELPTSYGQW